MRESPRIRRLRSDLRSLQMLRAESSILDFEVRDSRSDSPDAYLVRFRGRGLWRPAGSAEVLPRGEHEVLIRLGANYPRMMPELTWKTPIFHPNISTSGFVCLGGFGTFWAPSLNLDQLCTMLWDMVRYENYDVKSPYNREAASWAHSQKSLSLPIDPRPLRDRAGVRPRSGPPPSPTLPRPAPASVPPDIVFLDDVVVAEVVDEGDADVLIIE